MRNPARFTRNQVLNFELKKDIDYCMKATEKWDELTHVPQEIPGKGPPVQLDWIINYVYQGSPGMRKNLMMHYGEISRDEIRQMAMTNLGTNNQQDQDSNMIYHCLRKSISNVVFAKVTTELERYTFIMKKKKTKRMKPLPAWMDPAFSM